MKPAALSFDNVNLDRLSPQSKWTLEHVEWPIVEEWLDVPAIAQKEGLETRAVKRMRVDLRAEVRAQQLGAELPRLPEERYEALRESIRLHGQLVPILRDRQTGQVLDGDHRLRACAELGLEPLVKEVDGVADVRELRLSVNTARRQLERGDLRTMAAAEILHDPSRSDRAIGALLGCAHKTVARARADLERLGEVGTVTSRVGRDGVARPGTNGALAKTVTIKLARPQAIAVLATLLDLQRAGQRHELAPLMDALQGQLTLEELERYLTPETPA